MRYLIIIPVSILIFLGACSDPSASKQAIEVEAKANLLKQQQETIKLELEAKAKEQAAIEAIAQQKLAEAEAKAARKAAIELTKKRAEYDEFKKIAIDAANFAEQTANDQKTALENSVAEAKKSKSSDPAIDETTITEEETGNPDTSEPGK